MEAAAPRAFSFFCRKEMYTSTWRSSASLSKPHTFSMIRSLESTPAPGLDQHFQKLAFL